MDGENTQRVPETPEQPENLAIVGDVESPDGTYQAFSRRAPDSLALLPDQPGMQGYLAPKYVLADRGLFFTDGAFKKTAKERMKGAHHLYDHDTWMPESIIGTHTDAVEDERGLSVTVLINEANDLGRLVMSNYRFGIKYGWSYGWDTVRDRSGTPDDDKRLDRSGAPHLANVPINELRAITETRAWEGSTVPWGGIHSAGPDVVQSRLDRAARAISTLIAAIAAGTLSPEQERQAEALVRAWEQRAAAGSTTAPAPALGTRNLEAEFAYYFGDQVPELGSATAWT
jgi:hypothetical protein